MASEAVAAGDGDEFGAAAGAGEVVAEGLAGGLDVVVLLVEREREGRVDQLIDAQILVHLDHGRDLVGGADLAAADGQPLSQLLGRRIRQGRQRAAAQAGRALGSDSRQGRRRGVGDGRGREADGKGPWLARQRR